MNARKPAGGYFIGTTCPGCGGELHLETDFFVTSCGHCGSILRLIMPGVPPAFLVTARVAAHQIRMHVDRHLKLHHLPLTGGRLQVKKFYYPYWKVDARVLKLRNRTEVKRIAGDEETQAETVIETNRSSVTVSPYLFTIAAGVAVDGVPESLGMRPETVRLTPRDDDTTVDDFDILPVLRPLSAVEQKLKGAVAMLSSISPADFGRNVTRLFSPSWSLVYFPYIIVEEYGDTYRRFVLDGLVGRVIRSGQPGEGRRGATTRGEGNRILRADKDERGSVDDFGGPQFEDVLAHEVAAGLQESETDPAGTTGAVDGLTFGRIEVDFHRCDYCGADLPATPSHLYVCSNCHALQMMDNTSVRLTRIEAASAGVDRAERMVPFWKLDLPNEVLKLCRSFHSGPERIRALLIPAIRSGNHESLHKLARRMTTAQEKFATEAVETTDERFLPVQVGLDEALAMAEMIVCRELVDSQIPLPEQELEVAPSAVSLVYFPFRSDGYFCVDTVLNAVSFERALVEPA